MEFNNETIKKIIVLLLILFFGIIVFFVIKPIFLSIIGGLFLAYIFFPLYKVSLKIFKFKNLTAVIITLFVIFIFILLFWLVLPTLIREIFNIYTVSQNLDVKKILTAIFPSSSEQFITQMVSMFNNGVTKASSLILNYLMDFLFNLPNLSIHLFIVFAVFYFALKDSEYLKETFLSLSPFNKEYEKSLSKQFNSITYSLVYGQIIVGLVQGLFAGLGFWIFGIKNVFVLTLLAILFSIIPFIGPAIIWGPASIYLFVKGDVTMGILFLIYNLTVVSFIDNVVRGYLVSKTSSTSPAIILIGMFGGWFVFGIMGMVIGPLALAYLMVFLRAYREGTLVKFFAK